jgi:hypothetical protein
MEEAEPAVREARLAALRDDELSAITSLRIRHATEVERLQHRICASALGVRGTSSVKAPPYRHHTFAESGGTGRGEKGSGLPSPLR